MNTSARRVLLRALAVGLVALGLHAAPAGAVVADTGATSGTTTTAYDLIDSVGVNVHMHFSDTTYADSDRVLTALQDLGVRHVRDGLAGKRPDEVAALATLGAHGITSVLHLSGVRSGATLSVDPEQISELRQLAPYVDAVEPVNEFDCTGPSSWAAPLRSYTTALQTAVRGDAATANLPLLAPSFCRPESVATYGSVTDAATLGNAHTYAIGKGPELPAESRLPAFAQAQGTSLPQYVTESGYTNLGTASYPYAATEAAAADYVVRTLLDHKRIGVAHTYLYELLDEKKDGLKTDPEQHFGLVRYDNSRKPAFTAIRNLLGDLAGGAPSSVQAGSRASAPYTTKLVGGGSLLRSLTITDPHGGGQTVALWLAAPSGVGAGKVRMTVTGSATMTTRQPSRGNAVTTLGTGTTFDIPVNGAVTLVHLGAPTSGGAQACTASADYTTLASTLGATASSTLSPTGWSGAPAAASGVPSWLTGGSQVGSDAQKVTVPVPGNPTTWSIGVWARMNSASADYATFLHAAGVSGGTLTTYNLTVDAPSHAQVAGYGPPPTGGTWGSEIAANAATGTWHYFALVADGAAKKTTLYVDGVASGSKASKAAALTGVEVGSLTSGFRGAVSNLAVFPKALTAAQQLALATSARRTC
ncbi:LamG-like jellyroll fold domain-containing protein [Nocardioides jejuensis]|uniref:LamG domain-containing protein n=1 Tax=Nocardioides jejuensis TaxID=2502782 RepID=A0A4R1CJ64_9ACTN|nr:LamG-like jellyroll fold domain-containing protein [Nocardioides jejuensis]TCJ30887.1 LamG domain-containing protein [Nocardioides jejuensis]